MKNLFLFSLAILFFSSGCREIAGRRVRGSGDVTTQSRAVSGFRNIDVSGAIDVYVKQDSATSVTVKADDNIMQYIEVHTNGNTLEIYTERGIRLRPSDKIKVYVSNAVYEGFEVSGASKIITENELTAEAIKVHLSGASEGRIDLNAPRVKVNISGASELNLRGKTKDLDLDASGASKIKGYDLLTENTHVNVSGASHAEVYASVSLNGQASGASSVNYKGNASESVDESGASHVSKKQ